MLLAYPAKICCYTINFKFSTLVIKVILSNMGSICKNTSWYIRISATHSLLSLIITGGRVSPWWAVTGHFTRFLMAFSLGPIGKMSSNKCLWASYPQARGTDLSGEFFFAYITLSLVFIKNFSGWPQHPAPLSSNMTWLKGCKVDKLPILLDIHEIIGWNTLKFLVW